jgi:hypothetical protein
MVLRPIGFLDFHKITTLFSFIQKIQNIRNTVRVKILSINQNVIQNKCKLLLFEYLQWDRLSPDTFNMVHNHIIDEYQSLPEICPGCKGITKFQTTYHFLNHIQINTHKSKHEHAILQIFQNNMA